MSSSDARETLTQTRNSAAKFYKTFWGTEDVVSGEKVEDDDDDDSDAPDGGRDSDEEALKSVAGSSSLDEDGGSCGPGDDAFCFSNFLWLFAAGLVIYYSDFVSAVIVSPMGGGGGSDLNLTCYWIGIALLSTNFCIFYYLVVHLSWFRGVKSDDWDSYIPYAVPVATASFVGAALFLSLGLWPQYGVLTVPILSTVFMGFIVLVSMGSQAYKWRRFRAESERDKKSS